MSDPPRPQPSMLNLERVAGWRAVFPVAQWLPAYRAEWLRHDAIAGVTLAAYGIPVSLAYATLAAVAAPIRHLLLSARRPLLRHLRILAAACRSDPTSASFQCSSA